MNTKHHFRRIYLSLLSLFLFAAFSYAQHQKFTPYDELPSVVKTYKPEYREDMPEWGKMLYQYPVNYYEVNKAYRIWEKDHKGQKSPLIRYYKLWQRHLEPFVSYDGTINLPDKKVMEKEMLKMQQKNNNLQRKTRAKTDATSTWSFVGPKETIWLNQGSTDYAAPKACPWQANVYSIDVTDANPNVIFCGTETGYVNKSIDKGETWQQVGRDYVFGGGVTATIIHPTNSDIVWVAAGRKIHKTIDGGITWTPSTTTFYANRLKVDSDNPEKLYAAAAEGLFVSEDGGTTWYNRSNGDFYDIDIKPDDHNIVYGLTKNSSTNKFKMVQSNNAGKSFEIMSTFPPDIDQRSGGLLATTPKNPNRLYVIMLSDKPYFYKGRYDTEDKKWYWTKTYEGTDGAFTGNELTNGQGYFDLVLAVSPINEYVIFLGTTTLFKSTNGGTQFTAVGGYQGSFAIHPDIQDIKMLSNGDTWVSTDGGVNYSSDYFRTYDKYKVCVDGLIGSDFWGFDQGWNEDIMVGGRYHNGNTAIADFYGDKALRMGGAESATGWVIKGKSRHVAFDDLGDGWILPKTIHNRPQGRFRFTKHPNMDGYGASRSNVVTHPNYSGTVYVGSENSIWKSEDYGANFDLLYKFSGRIKYFNISTSNPDVMYADVDGYGLYRSSNGGRTWIRRSSAVNWNGRMTFAISPYDENVIYASAQAKNWDKTNDVYRSTNGGITWKIWSEFKAPIKSLVVQPTKDGKDLVYAFITFWGSASKVYIKKDGDSEWRAYDNGYPRGLGVNIALPFFRDAKIRVAGNSGVWECPLAETDFTPVVVPWVEKRVYDCNKEVVQFDCHSIVKHEGATWHWDFLDESNQEVEVEAENINIRNPKVKFKEAGTYGVRLTITQNGKNYVKEMTNFIKIEDCPSLNDCNRPGDIPFADYTLIEADSYQKGTNNEPEKAFDGDVSTIWHTPWGSGETSYPHHIALDLGDTYYISKMEYTTRSDGNNGNVKKYKLYLSESKEDWGNPVAEGEFDSESGTKTITFEKTQARYAKFVAISEVNGRTWTSVAELKFIGCLISTGVENIIYKQNLTAFPIPSNAMVTVKLPFQDGLNTYKYGLYNTAGQRLAGGTTQMKDTSIQVDMSSYPTGNYLVVLRDEKGVTYRVKVVKN